MQAGHLRHRVTIQTQLVTRNGSGEECIEWQDVETIWAEVKQTKAAREGFIGRADQIQATSDFQVTVRYWKKIEPDVKQRIVWDGKYLDVQNVISDRVGSKWTIMCEAVI